MEPEDSQQPVTPILSRMSSAHTLWSPFFKIYARVSIRSSLWSLDFSVTNVSVILSNACYVPRRSFLPDLIRLIIFGEEYTWRSSLRNLLEPHVTSSSLRLNLLLTKLFWKTPSPCLSLNMSGSFPEAACMQKLQFCTLHFLLRGKIFSLLHVVETDSETHLAQSDGNRERFPQE
jgi:hypothetical protein